MPPSEPQGNQPGNINQSGAPGIMPPPDMGNGNLPYPAPSGNKKKKLILGISGGVAVVAIAAAVYVFGFYIPNLPENVWKSGLERSGQALNAATTRFTSKETIDKYSKSAFDGTFSYKTAEASGSGSFDAKFDSTNATANATTKYKMGSDAEKQLGAQFMAHQTKNSLYPTVYFKFTGLKDLDAAYASFLSAYDDKWLMVDETTFKTLGVEAPKSSDATEQQITAEDVAEASKVLINTTTDYVFTTDPSKAVWERKSFVGKEKVDGVNTYHYTVAINTEHARAYCRASTSAYFQTALAKKIIPDAAEREEEAKTAVDDCKTDVDDKEIAKSTYDLWMDTRTKMLYKIRTTEVENTANYVEVGQKYDGSDTLHFFVNMIMREKAGELRSAETSNMTAAFDVNIKEATITANVAGNGDDGDADSKYEYKATVTSKPYQGAIDTTAPSGAIPLLDAYGSLLDSSMQDWGSEL